MCAITHADIVATNTTGKIARGIGRTDRHIFYFQGVWCGVVACVFVCVQTIVGGICVLCACVPHVLRESCPNDVVSCLWLWALPGLLFFSVCVGCPGLVCCCFAFSLLVNLS